MEHVSAILELEQVCFNVVHWLIFTYKIIILLKPLSKINSEITCRFRVLLF